MPIRETTPRGETDRFVNGLAERVRQVLVRRLGRVGEQVVNAARSLPSPKAGKDRPVPPHQPNYIDWTANLRSSIGYVIAEDGKIVGKSGFKPVKGGKEGARKGRELAEQLARQTKGLTLVVVAGENYAKYVAAKGYDVLDSAELLAQRLVPEMLKQLKLI